MALVAVLRGGLFGLSDRWLYDFRQAGGEFSYRSPVPEGLPSEAAGAFREAFSRLERYARWLTRMPELTALERIAADLGLFALAAARPGGDLQAGSIGKALELLRADRAVARDPSRGLAARLRWLAGEQEADGIAATASQRPAVRVMNLHKVKGLEAPVVFLADPAGEMGLRTDLHIDRGGERSRGYLVIRRESAQDHHGGRVLARPAGWEECQEREKRFLEKERARLKYVAATRAGSLLVVSRADKEKYNYSPWKLFEPRLEGVAELEDPGEQRLPAGEDPPGSAAVIAARRELEAALQALRLPSREVRAARELALSTEAGSLPWSDPLSAADYDPASRAPAGDGEHGLEWGLVAHRLLELALRRGPNAPLVELAREALEERGMDPGRAEEAVELIRSLRESELWRRAGRSPERCVETPFHVLLGPEDSPLLTRPTLLRGAIDLAFREDECWVLIDYKTDRAEDQETRRRLTARYAPQLELYRLAWEKSTGARVSECGLFFCRPGCYLRVDRGETP